MEKQQKLLQNVTSAHIIASLALPVNHRNTVFTKTSYFGYTGVWPGTCPV